jgi:hypothetical protein
VISAASSSSASLPPGFDGAYEAAAAKSDDSREADAASATQPGCAI